jgi:hypothetical protein
MCRWTFWTSASSWGRVQGSGVVESAGAAVVACFCVAPASVAGAVVAGARPQALRARLSVRRNKQKNETYLFINNFPLPLVSGSVYDSKSMLAEKMDARFTNECGTTK